MKKAKKKSKLERTKPIRGLPVRFEPKFLDEIDSRLALAKKIQRRRERLIAETGATSYQQLLIVDRATFLVILLETMEMNAVENHVFDSASYVQNSNCLVGLLRSLGLKSATKHVESLSDYVENGGKK